MRGIENAVAAYSANAMLVSPSVHERLAPKKRVTIITIRIGISSPTAPWIIATSEVATP